jgi:hypothetical protein
VSILERPKACNVSLGSDPGGAQMPATCDSEETRAIALAGMSLSYALAGMLKRVGALAPEAAEDAFVAALLGVESSFSPNDPSAALARQLLDLMGGQLAALRPEPDHAHTLRRRRGGRAASASTLP